MRFILAILAVLVVTTAVHGQPSAGGATSPDPGELWNAFPLDRAPQDPPSPSEPAVTPTPPAADGSGSTGAGGNDFARVAIIVAAVLAGIAITVLAGIAMRPAATVLLGRRRRRRGAPPESDATATPDGIPAHADTMAPATANWPPPTPPNTNNDEVAKERVATALDNGRSADRPADTPDTTDAANTAPATAKWPWSTAPNANDDAAEESVASPVDSGGDTDRGATDTQDASDAEHDEQRVVIPIRTPTAMPPVADASKDLRPATAAARGTDRTGATVPPNAGAIRDLGRPTACVIDWWAGVEGTYFYARVDGRSGGPVAVTRSSMFAWEGPGEPPQRHDTLAAHRQVVETLLDLGWKPNGTGSRWYQVSFRSPEVAAPRPRVVIQTVDRTD